MIDESVYLSRGIDVSVDSFQDRLKYLLRDRAPNTWGKTIGSNSGTITRMMKGHIPGVEIMAVIWRVENVNPAWLEYGIGDPFIVHKDNDACLAEELQAVLSDELDWQTTVLSDGVNFGVLLTQPGCVTAKDGSIIPYTVVEFFGKGCAQDTFRTAVKYSTKSIMLLQMETDDLDRFLTGYMGSYEILGDSVPGKPLPNSVLMTAENAPLTSGNPEKNPRREKLHALIDHIDDQHLDSLFAHGNAIAELAKLKKKRA